MTTNDRRKHERHKTVFWTAYMSVSAKGSANSKNFSRGGVFVEVDENFMTNAEVEIKIVTHRGDVIHAKGKIIRVENVNNKLGLAIEFDNISEKDLEALESKDKLLL